MIKAVLIIGDLIIAETQIGEADDIGARTAGQKIGAPQGEQSGRHLNHLLANFRVNWSKLPT